MNQVQAKAKTLLYTYVVGAALACSIPQNVVSGTTSRSPGYSAESQNKNATASPRDSEMRKLFRPKSRGDGKLTDDVWFHEGSWIGPDEKTLWVMTAKFGSAQAAVKWINDAIVSHGKVSDRRLLVDPNTGGTIGDRIVATLPAAGEDEAVNVLVWTDGATVRKISAPSLENVLLAEKIFFPRYYKLTHK
jgi:hypothetical protein